MNVLILGVFAQVLAVLAWATLLGLSIWTGALLAAWLHRQLSSEREPVLQLAAAQSRPVGSLGLPADRRAYGSRFTLPLDAMLHTALHARRVQQSILWPSYIHRRSIPAVGDSPLK